ncbi:MAG: lytic murein transglycosylase [Desulfobacterales bacterium]|jgi:membrane-bound lytic murein transglycosylase B
MLQIFFICFLITSLFSPAVATVTPNTNNHYFETVQKKLIKDGFDPDKIQRLYSRPQIKFEADGVSIFFTYSEAKVDYAQFANDWSIRKARKYMQTYHEDLQRTEEAFGVDSQVITAILLVETGLGSTVGTRSTLNTLSTMASLIDPQVRSSFWDMTLKSKKVSRKKFEKKALRKSKWAYRELKAFLTYAYQEGLDPAEIPGSIAGAIGYAQFMPSNILAYGKDGNNDGSVDLLTHADSMASIANFLKRHGWRPGISRKKAEKVIYHYNHSDYYVNVVLKITNLLKG